MATHSNVLAWRIPGTGSLVGCRLWGHTESDTMNRLSSSSSSPKGPTLKNEKYDSLRFTAYQEKLFSSEVLTAFCSLVCLFSPQNAPNFPIVENLDSPIRVQLILSFSL